MEGTLLALRLVLAAILYLFLGLLLYTLWRNLRQNETTAPVRPPAASLVWDGDIERRPFELLPITGLGRAPDNAIVLEDPFASAHHALIQWRDGRWWIEDLGSHNGTFLNEQPITEAALLTPGDQIRIGETLMRFGAYSDPDKT